MAATATAPVASEKESKQLDLLMHLAEGDNGGVFHADLPKGVSDLGTLNRAWIEGLIEFGRQNSVETGVPTGSAAVGDKHTIIEPTFNWTGPKRTSHKSLRDLIAEDEKLPTNCVMAVETEDAKGVKKIGYQKQKNDALRLRVRLTDKGYAALQS